MLNIRNETSFNSNSNSNSNNNNSSNSTINRLGQDVLQYSGSQQGRAAVSLRAAELLQIIKLKMIKLNGKIGTL